VTFDSESHFTAVQKENVQVLYMYVIAHEWFYQASPHVSTASYKCWGEKAWVYEAREKESRG